MFIGHFAVGFGGRALGRGASLGTWILAAQWVDLVWPLLVLAGVERLQIAPGDTAVTPLHFTHYPYTHSLVAAVLWGVLFGAIYWWRRRNLRTAAGLGAAVLSHWVLDWISHRPDLPLVPGGSVHVGLGLWHSVVATVVVEGSLFAVCVALYLSARRGRLSRPWATWGLIGVLVVVYAANLLATPPPNAQAVALSALGMWLFVAWGYWIDRTPRNTARVAAG